jgi:Lon protease-like protein
MPESWLPLFPLSAVLFPGSSLPLHIYEERYKILVRNCLKAESGFGINLVRATGMASVGCSATVTQVLREYDDGRQDIVVKGGLRYDLLRTDDGRAPYLFGEVRFISDDGGVADRSLSQETIRLLNEVIARAYKGDVAPFAPDREEGGLSYVLAQKAGLDLEQRQAILELSGENERMQKLHQHLKELLPRLEYVEEVERVVKNDGYL